MPNYINFDKPQNEIFKQLDGKIQKIVAAHSNLNKLYALNDFPGLSAASGPKRQPFELPPQLPRPPPWIPKCSTSDDDPKQQQQTIMEPEKAPLASNYSCSSSLTATSSPSCCSKEDLVQHVTRAHQSSQMNLKNQMVNKFLAQTDTLAKQPGSRASFILDAAISKLHQRHQEQKLKEHQQKRRATTQLTSNSRLSLAPSSSNTISVTHIRDINSMPCQTKPTRPIYPSSSSSSLSLSLSTTPTSSSSISLLTTPQPQIDTSLSSADFGILAEKIKETIHTQNPNLDKKTPKCLEEGRKYQEAIMSQFKEQLYSMTKSIKLKIPPPTPNASSNIPTNLKEQKSFLMKKSPQSLFKTIQKETSLLLNRRHSLKNVRSRLSLLSDQQNVNHQNAQVKQATLTKTPLVYKPNTMRVIVPPTKTLFSLKFTNYLEEETPQPTTDLMTIDEFAKGLNLVRSNDALLQRHQEQLLRSNSNWMNSASTRPMRLRRIRGEKMRMPVSASYKAARKIGLQ